MVLLIEIDSPPIKIDEIDNEDPKDAWLKQERRPPRFTYPATERELQSTESLIVDLPDTAK
jgi:hypothetical protein